MCRVLPGDIVLTGGGRGLPSRLIRFVTRRGILGTLAGLPLAMVLPAPWGILALVWFGISVTVVDAKTWASHVSMVTFPDGYMDRALVVEANLYGVGQNRLGHPPRVEVWRPINLNRTQLQGIQYAAHLMIGYGYDFRALLAWAGDWILGVGAWYPFVFRRMLPIHSRRKVVCSSALAIWYQFFTGADKNFGESDPRKVSPDTIADFVRSNPDKYRLIHTSEVGE